MSTNKPNSSSLKFFWDTVGKGAIMISMTTLIIVFVCIAVYIWISNANAEHSVPYCYGNETGYWMPIQNIDKTISLVITKKDDSLEQHNVICFVRNNQQIKAILPETGI